MTVDEQIRFIRDNVPKAFEAAYANGKTNAESEIESLNDELEQTLYGTDADKTLDENVEQTKSDFQAIKDKIVDHGVEMADGTKTAEYASKVDDVFESGKKSEYDAFWDTYQDNGKRDNYNYAFYGRGWTDETFKPKYDFPKSAYYVNAFNNTGIRDFKGILERQGIYLNLEGTGDQGLGYLFMNALVTHIGRIKYPQNVKTIEQIFAYCRSLITVDELHLSPDGSTILTNALRDCPSLENLKITGTNGQNGFNVQWSTKLSKASMTSIVNALSATTSGLTVTLSKKAVNNAFETSEGAADGSTSTEWTTLIGTKTNWTISLV